MRAVLRMWFGLFQQGGMKQTFVVGEGGQEIQAMLGQEKGAEDSIPALLVRQVQSSVFMEDTIRRMGELGLDALVEIGPGKALSGFVKKTVPGLPVYAVESPADVEALEGLVKENG